MKKINRILIILLIILSLFSFTSFVKANSEYSYCDFDEDVLRALYVLEEYQNNNYWYCVRNNKGTINVLFISKIDYPDLKQKVVLGDRCTFYFNTPNTEVTGIFYTYSSGTFSKSSATSHGYYYSNLIDGKVPMCSNISVYLDDDYTQPFFWATLQVALKGATRTILIVIMIVVGLMVSLIGLKKAFRTLVSGLKT